jgi:hypothetical protein
VVKVDTGNKHVTLNWAAVKKATSYGLCYATEAIVDINDCLNYVGGTWQDLTTKTFKITKLKNEKKYFFRVLAKNANGTLAISDVVTATPNKPSPLNDTGINNSQCYYGGNTGFMVSCTSGSAKLFSRLQDGMVGRDVTANSYYDGYAGFSFTKIGANGEKLPVTASSWACVKDNVTGLMWENKTNDGGLHDSHNGYTNNAAFQGRDDDASGFVAAVNQQTLCGASSWRLPSVDELLSIVNYSIAYPGPTIDSVFFSNTRDSTLFWSSSVCVGNSNCAWHVNFGDGSVDFYLLADIMLPIRLVSDSH